MASSSSTKLTKYKSAVTIVTSSVANSWYGGLHGSTEGDYYDEGDPLIDGHVHDGEHADGHAQKIHLVDHVTDQLKNVNLADDAVTKRNVATFVDQENAIPEYEIIDGDKHYYLDLSILRDEISAETEADSFGSVNVSANGGTVDGDGAVSINADTPDDDLALEAGANITITTDVATSTITISSTASGGSSNSFETIAPAPVGRGSSNTVSVVADSSTDTLSLEASDGIAIDGNSGSDSIAIRNRHAFSHIVLNPYDWAPDVGNGWGVSPLTNQINDGVDFFSYRHLIVNENSTYSSVPIPQNLNNEKPTSFIFRAYFISSENSPGYLLGAGNPNFSIDVSFGSTQAQATDNFFGMIGNGDNILANGSPNRIMWAPSTPITLTSIGVSDTMRLYVLETSLQDLEAGYNALGLLPLRMTGGAGFSLGGSFDGDPSRAEIHFLKSDFTWFI